MKVVKKVRFTFTASIYIYKKLSTTNNIISNVINMFVLRYVINNLQYCKSKIFSDLISDSIFLSK